ncbi:MAG: type II toxin-antitoxin system YafQ family toxin [Prevotella sp.]|nr:type II toxin-antitoxin system YafQ family toxin [Prevotella sp.]
MKYTIHYSGRFKKSYKLCKRRGLNIDNFEQVVRLLAATGKLPAKYQPHILSVKYAGIWECHIEPNWLLLWKQNDTELTLLLLDTGTHSDVF